MELRSLVETSDELNSREPALPRKPRGKRVQDKWGAMYFISMEVINTRLAQAGGSLAPRSGLALHRALVCKHCRHVSHLRHAARIHAATWHSTGDDSSKWRGMTRGHVSSSDNNTRSNFATRLSERIKKKTHEVLEFIHLDDGEDVEVLEVNYNEKDQSIEVLEEDSALSNSSVGKKSPSEFDELAKSLMFQPEVGLSLALTKAIRNQMLEQNLPDQHTPETPVRRSRRLESKVCSKGKKDATPGPALTLTNIDWSAVIRGDKSVRGGQQPASPATPARPRRQIQPRRLQENGLEEAPRKRARHLETRRQEPSTSQEPGSRDQPSSSQEPRSLEHSSSLFTPSRTKARKRLRVSRSLFSSAASPPSSGASTSLESGSSLRIAQRTTNPSKRSCLMDRLRNVLSSSHKSDSEDNDRGGPVVIQEEATNTLDDSIEEVSVSLNGKEHEDSDQACHVPVTLSEDSDLSILNLVTPKTPRRPEIIDQFDQVCHAPVTLSEDSDLSVLSPVTPKTPRRPEISVRGFATTRSENSIQEPSISVVMEPIIVSPILIQEEEAINILDDSIQDVSATLNEEEHDSVMLLDDREEEENVFSMETNQPNEVDNSQSDKHQLQSQTPRNKNVVDIESDDDDIVILKTPDARNSRNTEIEEMVDNFFSDLRSKRKFTSTPKTRRDQDY